MDLARVSNPSHAYCFAFHIMSDPDVLSCVVYRTNTFPLIHAGFLHTLMNVLALTPLLERFEAEYGTLTTLALFLGREFIISFVKNVSEWADVLK